MEKEAAGISSMRTLTFLHPYLPARAFYSSVSAVPGTKNNNNCKTAIQSVVDQQRLR
jgi:hypothetical protein